MSCHRIPRTVRVAARSVALAFLGMATLAGCGQKGPLFLPDSKPPVIQQPAPPPATTPAPEERDEEEKEKPH